MNLREQFNVDTKGHANFNAFCRAEVDKKPSTMTQALAMIADVRDAAKAHERHFDRLEAQATLYIRGRYPAWRIDARGTLVEMLEKAEQRSLKKMSHGMFRYGVRVVGEDGKTIKELDKSRR
jgi:hypothetical protein